MAIIMKDGKQVGSFERRNAGEEAEGEGSPVEAADSGREVETGEISNNPA